jgi:hypothetical protein
MAWINQENLPSRSRPPAWDTHCLRVDGIFSFPAVGRRHEAGTLKAFTMSAGIHVGMVGLRSASRHCVRSGRKAPPRAKKAKFDFAVGHFVKPCDADQLGRTRLLRSLRSQSSSRDPSLGAGPCHRGRQPAPSGAEDTGIPTWQGNDPHRSVTSGLLGDA